jgi:multidrug efflux pump subunit AcrA (membrane-fusion protein)
MSTGNGSPPYREEALRHYATDAHDGVLLRLTPRWTRWAYWLLVFVAAAAGTYGVLGRMHEYASGPAVVRVDGRIDLTAKLDGTVAAVRVQPGQHVADGQPLVQFFMDGEEAERARLQKEFDLQLLKLLRDPSDAAARQTLSSLRAQRDLATARLDQRLIRAPRAGVVTDVRIRPGEHLATGDLILSIVDDSARLSLLALLPGRYRPMLRVGGTLRFELVGYRYEFHELRIDAIGDEIVGPAEAKRYLGPGLADSVAIDGPVVLVRANLPATSFVSDGQAYRYFDGLQARAEARVRAEPLLLTLVPALRALWPHGS